MSERAEVIAFKQYMDELCRQDVAVAFSGGADSALLLKAAVEASARYGKKVYAITVQTKLHPAADLPVAKQIADEIGAIHVVLYADEFADEAIRQNPKNRCYLCKRNIFTGIKEYVAGKGVSVIIEGTNEDDLHVYRPGIQALKELNIISPLAESHMTKAMVRELAADYGISAAERPSAPCLATRLPYGQTLDPDLLAKIDEGEMQLKKYPFYNVRLRVHKDVVRIEVDQRDLPLVMEHRENIVKILKELGFRYITLDLEGFRSGSMDEQ